MPCPENSTVLTVYLVGADADDAATCMPFVDHRGAADHARAEQTADGHALRVFIAAAVLDLSSLAPADDDPADARGGRPPGSSWQSRGARPVLYRCCGVCTRPCGDATPREDVGLVGIDAEPGFPAWWDDRDRWNGWLNPAFTREAADAVVMWINKCYAENPEGSDRLEWVGDTILHHSPMYETEPGYAPVTIRPTEDGRWYIGGWYWTWCKVGELPARIDRIVTTAESEILADIAAGRVPETAGTFAELQDHVDANEYGGLCDPARAADVEHADVITIQTRLDTWLRAGRPTQRSTTTDDNRPS